MYLPVVVGDGLGVVVPALLSFSNLIPHLFRVTNLERRFALVLSLCSFRAVVVVPEEGDHLSIYVNRRSSYSIIHLVYVGFIFCHNEGGGIH